MKILFALILFIPLTTCWARRCEVFGISDSPQSLSCTFPKEKIELRCVSGRYFLNRSPVTSAYHFEVEEGDVPLVFETKTEKLVVTGSLAELERDKASVSGSCH